MPEAETGRLAHTPRTGGRLSLLIVAGLLLVAVAAAAVNLLAPGREEQDPPGRIVQILNSDLPPPTSNVVVFLIDALRADHVGCYGYDRDTSPNIDSLADVATVYLRNKSQSSVTPLSISFLLTGRIAAPRNVRKGCPTMAETLHAMGYRCMAIQTNPWLDKPLFSRGFDDYTMLLPEGDVKESLGHWVELPDAETNRWYSDAAAVRDEALRKISALAPDRRFFLYLHLMDPHEPYIPKPEYDVFSRERAGFREKLKAGADFIKACESGDAEMMTTLKGEVVALYDGEILEADCAVAAVIEALKERDMYDNTIIVVCADHGEMFGEHGLARHAEGLSETELCTPLIIKFAQQKEGSKFKGLSRNIDMMPTVLAALGLTDEQLQRFAFDGVPLQTISPDADEVSKAVLMRAAPRKLTAFSVEKNGLKLIVRTEPDVKDPQKPRKEIMLFNVARDPGETARLESVMPDKVLELAPLLPVYEANPSELEEFGSNLTEAQRNRLKAIGYLQ